VNGTRGVSIRGSTTFPETLLSAVEDKGSHAEIHQAARLGAPVAVLHIAALTLTLHAASGKRQRRGGPCEEATCSELLGHSAIFDAAMNRHGLEPWRRG